MIQIEINPVNIKNTFIENLNLCFSNWGGEKNYKHYFERSFNAYKPDIILFRNSSGEVIAGSGISYRTISIDGSITLPIGIMTGSWTLPKARGMGCFARMIEVSRGLCKEKNVPLLTAFVTEDNASYRRLINAGSVCVPANNYFYEEGYLGKEHGEVKQISLKDDKVIFNLVNEYYRNKTGFNYTIEQFKEQYLNRLFPVNIWVYKGITYITEHSNITKLLFVSQINPDDLFSFMAWLYEKFKKNIMWFSSDKQFIRNQLCKLKVINGFFTIIETGKSMPIHEFASDDLSKIFSIQLGDKV
jgi:hypothetical protein